MSDDPIHPMLDDAIRREQIAEAQSRIKALEESLRQARLDALEEAAKVAADFFEPRLSDPLWTVRNLAQMDIAAAIRKLKETDNG